MPNSFRRLLFTGALFAAFVALNFSNAYAQKGRTKNVRFACGQSSIVLSGTVARGAENRYIVMAREGQTMTVNIVSNKTNANFIIFYAGEQESLEGANGVTTWRRRLDANNNYVIVVGQTGGAARYTLKIAVD